MSFLKKTDDSPKKTDTVKKGKKTAPSKKIVKKKTKISFGRKKNEELQKKVTSKSKKNKKVKDDEVENNESSEQDVNFEIVDKSESEEDITTDIFSDDALDANEKETTTPEKEPGSQWSPSKKKKFLLRDMKGKLVFLEDTGEKLGTVHDMMYDGEKKLIGYKIKDKKTDSVLCFPVDQFDVTKDGLIFIQGWYTKSVKTIDQLEFKERVSPELTTLISDDAISNEELYNIFVKHDDQMAHYIEESVTLKELLNQRLAALEKQRLALKDDLMDLTEKRLIKDIDRREFSEDVMKHRHKVNVLDVNINKCKVLLSRLDKTSFGRLGKHIVANIDEKNSNQYVDAFTEEKDHSKSIIYTEEIENPYKQKYDDMKERFEQLQENYDELKTAVEKLVEKGEL